MGKRPKFETFNERLRRIEALTLIEIKTNISHKLIKLFIWHRKQPTLFVINRVYMVVRPGGSNCPPGHNY